MRFDTPLTFQPIYMERVWGGRRLAELPSRDVPPGKPIGESWELVDRVDAQSIVNQGPCAGMTLHELWTSHRLPVFGDVPDAPRFPLLAKLLDASETLSVQVHPPAAIAEEMGGEPKSEMWYVLDATPRAELYAGFRNGVSREQFEAALQGGNVAELLHRIPVRSGDAIYIPSGRCHAIGAGCLIVEIQQNSDTTYRVFDWNRVGLDGRPRTLHVDASLRCIDFSDHEPGLAGQTIQCEHFTSSQIGLTADRRESSGASVYFTVLEGKVGCGDRVFGRADSFLLPASAVIRELRPLEEGTRILRTTLPTLTRTAFAGN
jgi:mannose-6-phosphate isomerase